MFGHRLAQGVTAGNSNYRTLVEVPGGANRDAYKTDKLLMRLIPKGVFTMGSPAGELGSSSDETRHQVTLTQDAYMGVFEITQKQWARVTDMWPSLFNNVDYRDARPVENVSYDDIRGSGSRTGWGRPKRARTCRTRGDSTTCTATSMSGAWTGTGFIRARMRIHMSCEVSPMTERRKGRQRLEWFFGVRPKTANC